jgi:hypothetical protein
MNTSTNGISKFLDKLIRPLFDKHVRSTTIIDDVDLLCGLATYVKNGYFKPTTQLCTFDITDLYKMLLQEESLDILTEFLLEHDYYKVKNILINLYMNRSLIKFSLLCIFPTRDNIQPFQQLQRFNMRKLFNIIFKKNKSSTVHENNGK